MGNCGGSATSGAIVQRGSGSGSPSARGADPSVEVNGGLVAAQVILKDVLMLSLDDPLKSLAIHDPTMPSPHKLDETTEKRLKQTLSDVIDTAKRCQAQNKFLNGRCMDEVLITVNLIKRYFPQSATRLKYVLKVLNDVVEKNLSSLDDSISDRMQNATPFSSTTNLQQAQGFIEVECVVKPEVVAENRMKDLLGSSQHGSMGDFGFFDISTHSTRGGGGSGGKQQVQGHVGAERALAHVIKSSVAASVGDSLSSKNHG